MGVLTVALLAALAVPVASATAASPPPSPCAEVAVAPYLDVADGSTHATAIDCARWLDVVRGTEPDRFSPAAPVRRDQMASVVARTLTAAGVALPAPERDRFSDLAGNVHRDAIERLAAAGIVGGYPDGTFRPAGTVARGQMTAFIVRAYEHAANATRGPAPDAFRDDDGHVHEATIDRAAARGFASGRTATTFAPDATTSRAETAAFLMRVLGALRGASAPVGPAFRAEVTAIPATTRDRMTGVSWREGCPVGLDDLRLVQVTHRGMDARDRWGVLVVHADATAAVTGAFSAAYEEGFAVARMELIDRYGADDDASMAADNTSGFNCRTVAGTTRWSQHAYGRAIDVNPVENPYVQKNEVDPPGGRAFVDRADRRPGMLFPDSAFVTTLKARGWGWGGDWSSAKDYQHLSATGS